MLTDLDRFPVSPETPEPQDPQTLLGWHWNSYSVSIVIRNTVEDGFIAKNEEKKIQSGDHPREPIPGSEVQVQTKP